VRGQRELGLYTLRAWVIHHNHVHVLMQPNAGTVHIAQTLMDASEAAAGQRFWERESYERVIRNERECAEAVQFVEQHPVRLALVDHAADWEWSSAHVVASERKPNVERLRLPFTSPCERTLARM
jgi:REP element-mobilizing transposase RayT